MEETVLRRHAYIRVRDLPYATDAAHDAPGLLRLGRGDCVAKANLLATSLRACHADVRFVSWEYRLPRLVPSVEMLAFDTDVHTSVQVRIAGAWVLADPTHDGPLAALDLTVGSWDGVSDTAPAYPPTGPVLVHTDTSDAATLDAVTARLSARVRATPAGSIERYRRELNALFDSVRC